MRNLKIKNRFISFVGIFVMLSVFLASVISTFPKKTMANASGVSYKASGGVIDNTEVVLSEIESKNDYASLKGSYSLRIDYPILTENQDKSVLCWAYAGAKALETALIINTGEYYNYSEVAVAYFAYLDGKTAAINSVGSFEKFDNVMRDMGLVSETDFSNDIFYEINEENQTNYNYVLKYADKNVAKQVAPVYLSANDDFLTNPNRELIVKYFIKNYGALSLSLPKGGTFYNDGARGYMFTTESLPNQGKVLDENHAVTLIGWNTYGFIALNSWGVDSETDYEEVIIPDAVMDQYFAGTVFKGNWLCGYDYVEDSNVKLESTTASEFSSEIIENDYNPVKNVFCYTEEIQIDYVVSNVSNFETVYVDVYKGTEKVPDNRVKVSYDDENNKITVKFTTSVSNFIMSSGTAFAGGNYSVHIYEDVNLISSRNIFIYTGTEVSYFKFVNTSIEKKEDETYYLMHNNYMSSASSPTYYIYHDYTYTLDLYLTDINRYSGLEVNVRTDVFDEVSGEFIQDINVNINHIVSLSSNMQRIDISLSSDYKGKLIKVRVTLNSPIYEDAVKCYYFNLFVSGLSNVSTHSNTYNILYKLDGGRNSENNVSKYPIYLTAGEMIDVKLFAPFKRGYTFMGWYTDSEYTNKIEKITSSNEGMLVLYAKWLYNDVTYFTSSLSLSNVYLYGGDDKTLSGDVSSRVDIVYGESFDLLSVFNLTEDLKNKAFSFKYYLKVNGDDLLFEDMIIDSENMTLQDSYQRTFGGKNVSGFSYPTLTVGRYSFELVSVVVIDHEARISESVFYEVNVLPKEIRLSYNQSKSTFVYDGTAHLPSIKFTGYYESDSAEFSEVKFNNKLGAKTDVGTYQYEIIDIKNKNYVLNENDKIQKYSLFINPKPIDVVWEGVTAVYNGKRQSPTYKITGIVGSDYVDIIFDQVGYINASTYKFKVEGVTNKNYIVSTNKEVSFEIKKAPIKVVFDNIEERAQKATKYRTPITYKIEGNLYDSVDVLKLEVYSSGLEKMLSGEYPISGTYDKSCNYEVSFVEGVYTLTGYYYVYYTLPNGEVYRELVNYGEKPVGITDDIYKAPFLSKLKYSTELVETGDDIYVVVTKENNTLTVLIVCAIIGFVGCYWWFTRKARRNKVR